MKKKILLIETEITDTGGHFFDNLIESYYSFKDEFNVSCILNNKFNLNNTFLPKDMVLKKYFLEIFLKKKIINFYIIVLSLFLYFKISTWFFVYFLFSLQKENY